MVKHETPPYEILNTPLSCNFLNNNYLKNNQTAAIEFFHNGVLNELHLENAGDYARDFGLRSFFWPEIYCEGPLYEYEYEYGYEYWFTDY